MQRRRRKILYAREVEELMASFPGRDFRMSQIINYVRNGRVLTPKQRRTMHVNVHRILRQYEDTGFVKVQRRAMTGAYALYHWKTIT